MDSTLIGLLIGLGFVLGVFASFFYWTMTSPNPEQDTTQVEGDGDSDFESASEDDDDQLETDIKFLEAQGYDEVMAEQYPLDNIKMVLCVREDLKMGKGKIGAQCGHATMGGYAQAKRWASKSEYWKKLMKKYSYEGTKKICVKLNSEQEV